MRPQRKRLSHDVLIIPDAPTIIFVTACTKNRERWLATPQIHDLLRLVWRHASAWLVGRYVVMPDHVHLFCTPGTPDLPLRNWLTYWKSRFSKKYGKPGCHWQSGAWDTRMRRGDSYEEKWEYVRNNPVRHGLVKRAEDWPYQGEMNALEWQ